MNIPQRQKILHWEGEAMSIHVSGKTYVVTGATSGIGLAVATELAERGASVIGIGRSRERCSRVQQSLQTAHPNGMIRYLTADLSLQGQIRSLGEQVRGVLQAHGKNHLEGLVNNASVFTYWLTLTAEGFETQWAVNHLAPFLVTHELLPLLSAASGARVVTVSSGSHFHAHLNWADIQLLRKYNCLRAYEQTKLANVLFTSEFNRRQGPNASVRGYAADPGLVKTDIGLKDMPAIARWIWKIRRSGGVPPEIAARGIVYLLGEASIQESGAIYWRDGKPGRIGKQACDPEAAGRLWSLSQQMCGL
jgi:NAD(P)-dependent dehydrogenase (short-subunit alcohol dehydrogenase family)